MDVGSIFLAMLGSNALSVGLTHWFNKRKTKAEATSTAMDGVVKWAESMRQDIERLTKDIDDLRVKYEALLKENAELHISLAKMKLELSKGSE